MERTHTVGIKGLARRRSSGVLMTTPPPRIGPDVGDREYAYSVCSDGPIKRGKLTSSVSRALSNGCPRARCAQGELSRHSLQRNYRCAPCGARARPTKGTAHVQPVWQPPPGLQ